MANPTEIIEIAFTTTPDDPSPVWVDVTQWVQQVNPGISITRGRQNERSEISPSTCTLTLDNADGRFTPEKTSSPYYPNVKKGRRIRVSVTHNSVTYRRFTGYIDEWAVSWPSAKTNQAFVGVTASSRLARLGIGTELASIIEEEYFLDGPRAYYPFGEPEGATQAGNVSTTTQPPMTFAGTGAAPVFGNATGPGTDGLTSVSFAGGKFLSVVFDQPVVTSADTTYAWEFFFNTSTTALQELGRLYTSTGDSVQAYISATGKLDILSNSYDGPIYYDLITAATVSDGATHHALVRATISGGSLVSTLYLDGAQVDTETYPSFPGFTGFNRLIAGGNTDTATMTGVLAHVAVTAGTTELTAARVDAHSDSGLNGFSGERSDQRIDRLAGYAGVPSAEVSTETGLSTSIANQLTNGVTALQAMTDVSVTEGGVLFDARDGTLTFHARSHRYNAASVLTLGTREIQPSLEPKLDDEGLVNDMTAGREGGVTVRAVDQASIVDYGFYRDSITLLTTSDAEVQDAANWKVFTASTPQVRVPAATVDLRRSTTAQATAILAREIGDRTTLADLPSQAPATSMDFFIEGYTEQITDTLYRITFNLSPATFSGVWQLDSSTYSQLGVSTRLAY